MKKKSLFFKFFIALMLFVSVPVIIITSILSYQVIKYSETELSKSATGKLKVAENLSELIAEKLYKDALELTLDNVLNEMAGIDKFNNIFSDTEALMKVYSMQEALIKLAGTNDILHSVYLFMDDTDYIMTSNQGIIEMSDFLDTSWLDEYESFNDFKLGSTWLRTRTIGYSGDNAEVQGASHKVITFFYTFTPYTTTVKGTLIFNIREDAIRSFVNSSSTISEGYIAIINQEGDVISHIQENLVGNKLKDNYIKKIQDSTQNEGYLIDYIDNARQLITYYKSDFNGWIYIGVFPIEMLSDKVNTLMMRAIYICLTLLFIGIFVSYIISKRLSSPLNKLVQDIRVRKGIDIKSGDSDMAILSGAFEYIVKEEDRLFSILEISRNNNRDVYLMNLFQSKPTEDLNSDLTGIEFVYDQYICAVILIDKFNEFTSIYSCEQREYMRMLILKVSEQLIGVTYKCYGMIYEKQRIALVVNFDSCTLGQVELCLKDIFVNVQEEISKVFDNTISVGIGNSQQSPDGVGESFNKAQEALKYKLIAGYGSINYWREAYDEDATYYYPFSNEKQIFNLINSGIADKLEAAVKELIQEIRDHEGMHYENVVQIFNQLTVNTVKFLLDLRLNISIIFGSNYNIYHILSTKETVDDIKDWLVDMYTAITKYLVNTRSQNKSYYDCALDYIHENYKKDIDINVIAESVGLSYSHLRKVFKDETGDNIINYINNMRINESKRILCQTNMTIKEIALNLGYNNEQSFVRFFKKYEKVSPGEFRISKKFSD